MSDRINAEIENCRQKRKFDSVREAEDAAYRARLEGRDLRVYECIWCRGWHLTSRR